MTMAKGTWAYTEHDRIFIPEKEFKELPDGYTTTWTRGYAHTQAVLDETGTCVGWILQETLDKREEKADGRSTRPQAQ
jgi:hypothetical protein